MHALLATTGGDGAVRLWDVATGPAPRTFTGHTGSVSWAAFSPDSTLLATTSNDKTPRQSGHARHSVHGHASPGTHLCLPAEPSVTSGL